MSQPKISLLPLTEEEKAALSFALVLVLNSIHMAENKDPLANILMKAQIKPLESIQRKLTE